MSVNPTSFAAKKNTGNFFVEIIFPFGTIHGFQPVFIEQRLTLNNDNDNDETRERRMYKLIIMAIAAET